MPVSLINQRARLSDYVGTILINFWKACFLSVTSLVLLLGLPFKGCAEIKLLINPDYDLMSGPIFLVSSSSARKSCWLFF